jgi:hypothetical protein
MTFEAWVSSSDFCHAGERLDHNSRPRKTAWRISKASARTRCCCNDQQNSSCTLVAVQSRTLCNEQRLLLAGLYVAAQHVLEAPRAAEAAAVHSTAASH